jgi:hypothetical protein
MAALNLKVSDRLHALIKNRAEAEEVSMADIVRFAANEYCQSPPADEATARALGWGPSEAA